jgi:hypothetical protein
MRCAPIHFDDLAFGSSLDIDPVPRTVGAAQTEHKPRKHIVQRALQRKTKDDGDNAGSRKQALDGKIEHIGDDGEGRGQVDESRKEVLNELPFVLSAFKNDDAANESDQEPSRPKPPSNLQDACYGVTERLAGQPQRDIRNNIVVKKQQGQQDQKHDPREGAPNWPLLQQKPAHEHANRHESKCAEERIPRCCLN